MVKQMTYESKQIKANAKLSIIFYFFWSLLLSLFQNLYCKRILIGLVLSRKFGDSKKE